MYSFEQMGRQIGLVRNSGFSGTQMHFYLTVKEISHQMSGNTPDISNGLLPKEKNRHPYALIMHCFLQTTYTLIANYNSAVLFMVFPNEFYFCF